jgi:hypothetical protein
MAISCRNCRSFDLGAQFDGFQCFSCGAHLKMDGSVTVPTSAIETAGSTYDGPGRELLDDPDKPPFRAQDPVR